MAGLLLSLLISVTVAIAGISILSFRDLPIPDAAELAGQIARNAEMAALVGAFGAAIGSLVRNQPTAIVEVLLFSFLIDPTVLTLAPDVGRFGPFGALPAAVGDIPPDDIGAPEGFLLCPFPAAIAMLAWIVSLFAIGAALLRRRDLD
ncbi:MAG TPA: hypothetical protein VHJ37_01750 [Thermoleophilaceae bacterium]|nr:hypothetical protein [Thermoleophilaceae bacterium]